jgi:chitinase
MFSLLLSFATRIVLGGCILFGPCNGQTLIAYANGATRDIRRYPVSQLTHIVYAFGHLRGNRLAIGHYDSAAIRRLARLKQNDPSLKVILSLGGWGGCRTCSEIFSNPTNRQAFTQSVVSLLDFFDVDGVDIDWEWPAGPGFPGHGWSPADRGNFTALIETLRRGLGTHKEISFLAAAFAPYLQQSYDWPRLMAAATRVHLMTYDLIGSRSPITAHHAALFSGGPQVESADHAVRYLDSLGVPRGKIAIGVAVYAREFVDVPDTAHGLFQPGRFKRFRTLDVIKKMRGYKEYWDDRSQAPYRYNAESKIFLTYDDNRSAAAKASYVRQHGLNGVFFWQLLLDKPRGGILDTLYKALFLNTNR